MTEGLFLITTLFVAYVVYIIMNEKKAEGAGKKSSVAASQPAPKAVVANTPKTSKVASAAVKSEPVKSVAPKPVAVKAVATKPAPAAKAAAAKPAAAKKAAPAAVPDALKGTGLKDPKTGEVAKTYSNYRFTKRWIKEALVSEGLIDKVYKNDELNSAIEDKIKVAVIKLEGMKKYQP